MLALYLDLKMHWIVTGCFIIYNSQMFILDVVPWYYS